MPATSLYKDHSGISSTSSRSSTSTGERFLADLQEAGPVLQDSLPISSQAGCMVCSSSLISWVHTLPELRVCVLCFHAEMNLKCVLVDGQVGVQTLNTHSVVGCIW
jgi:hypothetical protein